MIKNTLIAVFIFSTIPLSYGQKLTLDIEQNFSYISADSDIPIYLIEGNTNQIIFSGSNINNIFAEVNDDVLVIHLKPESCAPTRPVVVYYDKSYAKSKQIDYVEKRGFKNLPDISAINRL